MWEIWGRDVPESFKVIWQLCEEGTKSKYDKTEENQWSWSKAIKERKK